MRINDLRGPEALNSTNEFRFDFKSHVQLMDRLTYSANSSEHGSLFYIYHDMMKLQFESDEALSYRAFHLQVNIRGFSYLALWFIWRRYLSNSLFFYTLGPLFRPLIQFHGLREEFLQVLRTRQRDKEPLAERRLNTSVRRRKPLHLLPLDGGRMCPEQGHPILNRDCLA